MTETRPTSQPDRAHITIATGPEVAASMLNDLFAEPRRALLKWSAITNQTSQVRLAYPGQHLASIITGVKGTGTAARGHDLDDGGEVKSCSRADQVGACKSCGSRVLPQFDSCPHCRSKSITRKTDSHWILSMSTDQEYLQYVDAERLVFILFDRLDSKRSTVQVRAWEIWPAVPRHSYFRWFVDNYYRENYQKKVSLGKKPSPLNLHPLKFDFYMMNPVRTFTALISRADSTDAAIAVDLMIDPSLNRDAFSAEPMPAGVLTPGERVELLTNPKVQAEDLASANPETLTAPQIRAMRSKPSTVRKLATALRFIDEASRLQIPARVKRIKLSDSDYERR